MKTIDVKELIKEFKHKMQEKGWTYEDGYKIAMCAESEQAIKLFGSIESSYEYVLLAMPKYDNPMQFFSDFAHMLIPDNIL